MQVFMPQAPESGISIGEVARRAKLRPSAIRYYESIGLLPHPRRHNGRRLYDEQVFQQLSLVQVAQRAGFTMSEIRALRKSFPEGTAPSKRWQTLATKKLAQVNDLIQNAHAMKAMLERVLQCECADLDACTRVVKDTQTGELEMELACGCGGSECSG